MKYAVWFLILLLVVLHQNMAYLLAVHEKRDHAHELVFVNGVIRVPTGGLEAHG